MVERVTAGFARAITGAQELPAVQFGDAVIATRV
jgi:hypothetical protein